MRVILDTNVILAAFDGRGVACRDIDDVKNLGLAEVSKPDYIITGDKDLLMLKKFHLVPIITPREFWEISKSRRT